MIRELDLPLTAATLISQLPPIRTGRASFCLQLAGGRLLKGLRCELPHDAARVETLLRLLPAQCFPRPLARRGKALLLDWMPGVALGNDDCTTTLLRGCGRVAGRDPSAAHPATRTSAGAPPPGRFGSTSICASW